MSFDLQRVLNFDVPITHGKGRVSVTLPPDLHDYVMDNVNVKSQRAEFIRYCIRRQMEGTMEEKMPVRDTIKKMQREVFVKEKSIELLTPAERTQLRIQKALLDINTEVKEVLSKPGFGLKRRGDIDPLNAPDPPKEESK